jgi:Flp pilus assembly pilin Flp
MLTLLNNFIQEEEGSVVEYIIVLAVVAVIVALAFPQLRSKVTSWFNKMLTDVGTGFTG